LNTNTSDEGWTQHGDTIILNCIGRLEDGIESEPQAQ
ncbi:unnamed protein product, partial [Adineta steineri]